MCSLVGELNNYRFTSLYQVARLGTKAWKKALEIIAELDIKY